jgi:carbon monoxide dehydrogenase subunit G
VKSLRSRLLLFTTFLLVFPFFLRRRPRVERRITILAPPAAIFPFLHDLRNWPLWTDWNRREQIDYEYEATTMGDGAVQRWASEHMSGVMRILKSEPDERIDYELEMGDGAYQLVGRIELHPDGACTRVVWKCAWDLARNPYRRYFDLVMRWMIRRGFAGGLANLKTLVEAPVTPVSSAP